MLHIGGWFDPYLRGTLNLYREMANRSTYPQHLIVAPWAHLPWGRKLGMIDYGVEAENCIDEVQIRWFDHFLKGKDTGILKESPVSLFEMGSNQWRYLDEFPQKQQKIYYLASDGLAGMRGDSGMLWEYEAEKDSEEIVAPQDLATDLLADVEDRVLTIIYRCPKNWLNNCAKRTLPLTNMRSQRGVTK